jgi:5-(carboxyamino)imidazole ribonucleotide synthase
MMADGAKTLGIDLMVQTPSADDPAVAIASETIFAPIDDATATAQLAAQCDVITFENEFIDLPALLPLEQQGIVFRPRLSALKPLLDKYHQRRYLQSIGLPTPHFLLLEADIQPNPLESLNFPIVLKTRRHGYDGQGTFILQDAESLITLWHNMGQPSVLLEEFVPFAQELAIMAARSHQGEVVTYPVVTTEQVDQVCRRVFVPADISPAIAKQVQRMAETLLTELDVVGIFGIELFLTPNGNVLVNEIAPRTHNSGHYTLDACQTSQFEQQLRAVCGFSLGSAELTSQAALMVNLLGYEQSESDYLLQRQQLAQRPHTAVHWYGKTESRPGRKLGHVTVQCDRATPTELRRIAQDIEALWYPANYSA